MMDPNHEPALSPFRELGASVAAEWSRFRFSSSALSGVAINALQRLDFATQFDAQGMIRYLIGINECDVQQDAGSDFGQPPVILYWHPYFYIQALFWHTATTTIHSHAFDGAFQVLDGSSVQCTYAFEDDDSQRDDLSLRIGRISVHESRVLYKRDIEPIQSGDSLIHSVFHLGLPSLTLVIRTRGGDAAQHDYFPPGIALRVPRRIGQLTERKLQLLELLTTMRSPLAISCANAILANGNGAAVFATLQHMLLRTDPDWIGPGLPTLLACASNWSETGVERILEALAETKRTESLVSARRTVAEDDLRFFLALLITQPSRATLMDQVRKHTARDDAASILAKWSIALLDRRVIRAGASISGAAALAFWTDDPKDVRTESVASDIRLLSKTLALSRFAGELARQGSDTVGRVAS